MGTVLKRNRVYAVILIKRTQKNVNNIYMDR